MTRIAVAGENVAAPEVCPLCHHAIDPRSLSGHLTKAPGQPPMLDAVLLCPRDACNRLFVAHYLRDPSDHSRWKFKEHFPMIVAQKAFPAEITKTSVRFEEIYNQAHHADQVGLDLICGAGYRKALEFLVKDYAKSKNAGKDDKIEKKQLGLCIQEYIDHPTVQAIASRATWLGNDETHYIRKWADKDLSDLKKLIELTVHWISLDLLSAEVVKDMPDPKPARGESK